MTVQSKKDEILRLIRRVHSSEALAKSESLPSVDSPAPRSRPAIRPTPRTDLEALRRRRQQVEERLLEARAPLHLRDIERRLETLEEMLRSLVDGAVKAPPSLPAAEAAKAAGTAIHAGPAQAAAPPISGEEILSGKISEGVLADILQMLSSNQASGVFVITSAADGEHLHFYFEEGQISHADGVGLTGESALFAGMAVERGCFCFRETRDPPPERTINSKTQFLILEALRQIDEKRAGAALNE